MGLVKYAAARANVELGVLDEVRGKAIMEVALELAEGRFDGDIVVDVFQTGSGTGLNMNVNEVIAKEASRRAGVEVDPYDHVNKSQSSNDVVPTAIRLAAARGARDVLGAIQALVSRLESLARETMDAVKPGRTHLRDALPVTLGMELEAFAQAFKLDSRLLEQTVEAVLEVPLGGTAVGTGVNAPEGYAELAVRYLAEASGIPVKPAESPMRPMRLLTDLLALSSAYRAVAVDLWRLSQDLRLMYSGPNTGLGEVEIRVDIPGSSMMPGKRNPVTLEAAMQAAAHVMGLDQSMLQASLLGELELSMGIPLAGYAVDRQATLLTEALSKVADRVIAVVEPRRERMRRLAESSQALVTLLAPHIGYQAASRVAALLAQGKTLPEALEELGYPGDLAVKVTLEAALGGRKSREPRG
jgi:fumarate hydratase class II